MGERPAEMNVPTTPGDEATVRASAVETGAELEPTPADNPEQIRMQIEQTRDDMSETIDAIQDDQSPEPRGAGKGYSSARPPSER